MAPTSGAHHAQRPVWQNKLKKGSPFRTTPASALEPEAPREPAEDIHVQVGLDTVNRIVRPAGVEDESCPRERAFFHIDAREPLLKQPPHPRLGAADKVDSQIT